MSVTSKYPQFPFDSLDKLLKSHFNHDLIEEYYQEMDEWKKEIQDEYEKAEQNERNQVIFCFILKQDMKM